MIRTMCYVISNSDCEPLCAFTNPSDAIDYAASYVDEYYEEYEREPIMAEVKEQFESTGRYSIEGAIWCDKVPLELNVKIY